MLEFEKVIDCSKPSAVSVRLAFLDGRWSNLLFESIEPSFLNWLPQHREEFWKECKSVAEIGHDDLASLMATVSSIICYLTIG